MFEKVIGTDLSPFSLVPDSIVVRPFDPWFDLVTRLLMTPLFMRLFRNSPYGIYTRILKLRCKGGMRNHFMPFLAIALVALSLPLASSQPGARAKPVRETLSSKIDRLQP